MILFSNPEKHFLIILSVNGLSELHFSNLMSHDKYWSMPIKEGAIIRGKRRAYCILVILAGSQWRITWRAQHSCCPPSSLSLFLALGLATECCCCSGWCWCWCGSGRVSSRGMNIQTVIVVLLLCIKSYGSWAILSSFKRWLLRTCPSMPASPSLSCPTHTPPETRRSRRENKRLSLRFVWNKTTCR